MGKAILTHWLFFIANIYIWIVKRIPPTENGIQVSVGLDNLAQFYLIGVAVIIVAVSASSITVMGLKPREILSKMS